MGSSKADGGPILSRPMTNAKLGIGIIGAGSIVRHRHMPGLAKIDDVEVRAVCNRHMMSARQFADEFNVPQTCYDWRDVVTMSDVDIVWIGTTPYMHREIILHALAAGKHVFCQSRMCMNLDEARQIVTAAEQHPDRVLRFCPPPMGMAGDRTMKRLLHQEKFVGDIRHITLTSVNGLLLDPELPLTWRLQKKQSGQNVLTLGIYLEVLERWLGPIHRVMASSAIYTSHRPHPEISIPTPVEIPESMNVIAEYPNKAMAVLQFNGVSSHGPSDHLAIHGTDGTLVYDFNMDETAEQIEGAKRSDPGMSPIEIPDHERRGWTVEADFIAMVRAANQGATDQNAASTSNDNILPDAEAAMNYMNVIDAIHRSIGTGQATFCYSIQ